MFQIIFTRGHSLPQIINEINERLRISTNIIFCEKLDILVNHEESLHCYKQPITRIIYTETKALNSTNLANHLGEENKLFVVIGNEPPYELFENLKLLFQLSDFLLVIDSKLEDDIWKPFINYAWKLGYVKILIHSTYNGLCYDKELFPELKIKETTVEAYTNFREIFGNIHGYKVRVAAYNNVPRSLIYTDHRGKKNYAGYYMRFAQGFLASINATFEPIHTKNDSPQNCSHALQYNQVDMCGDALVRNPEVFTVTQAFRIAPATVVVAHAKPLLSFRYLTAPFKAKVWLCLVMYVLIIAGFLNLIHWLKDGRCDFSQALLEVFSSLLFSAFHLQAIHGRERYILFGILFISGFVYSTMYLGLLKSMLISEVFEKEIDSFEELVERNISLLIDAYDQALFMRHSFPDILWPVVRTVPSETLVRHRNNFDQDYAYVLFQDRLAMFEYAQQFLRHPKFRRIPINFCFLFAGFPMSRQWFLKHHLSRAWYHGFESGLVNKMATDAHWEVMSQGYLNFSITEYLEAKPLGLDYFVMPAIALGIGFSVALVSFGVELVVGKVWKCCN